MIGCTRSSLNVVASEKGVVVGRMKFRDDGDLIDCTKMGVGGKVIPSLIDRVSDISVCACLVVCGFILARSAIPYNTSLTRIHNILHVISNLPTVGLRWGMGGCAAFNVI